MSNIEQNLQKILSSRYGKDVRQSIHDSIHDCYEDGKAGAVDLVAREQIANLVANNNPTEGNSELIDTRVGYDGTTYPSAGEAIRNQVGSLSEEINLIPIYSKNMLLPKDANYGGVSVKYSSENGKINVSGQSSLPGGNLIIDKIYFKKGTYCISASDVSGNKPTVYIRNENNSESDSVIGLLKKASTKNVFNVENDGYLYICLYIQYTIAYDVNFCLQIESGDSPTIFKKFSYSISDENFLKDTFAYVIGSQLICTVNNTTKKGIWNGKDAFAIYTENNKIKYDPIEINEEIDFSLSVSGINAIVYNIIFKSISIINYNLFVNIGNTDKIIGFFYYTRYNGITNYIFNFNYKFIKNTNKTYEAIGDSLTYGFIGFNEEGGQNRLETPYPEKVSKLIGFSNVYNKGETGTTVANNTDVMGSYYPMSNDNRLSTYQNADIISVMGMTNDISKNIDLGELNSNDDKTFYGGYKKIINYLKTNYNNSFIFLIIPPITSNVEKSKPYIKAVLEMSDEYNVPCLNMAKYGMLDEYNKEVYTVDGTHFTQEYVDNVFAPIVANFIKRHVLLD